MSVPRVPVLTIRVVVVTPVPDRVNYKNRGRVGVVVEVIVYVGFGDFFSVCDYYDNRRLFFIILLIRRHTWIFSFSFTG